MRVLEPEWSSLDQETLRNAQRCIANRGGAATGPGAFARVADRLIVPGRQATGRSACELKESEHCARRGSPQRQTVRKGRHSRLELRADDA